MLWATTYGILMWSILQAIKEPLSPVVLFEENDLH